MTPDRPQHARIYSDGSNPTVQLLLADAGNRSAIRGMMDDQFDVDTSQTVTDADLYLVEDHLFPQYETELRERVEREYPVFCPVVLIRRESTDLGHEPLDASVPGGGVRFDDVVDAPVDPAMLNRRLHSLLVRRQQSRVLEQQVSTLEAREQRLRLFEQGVESTGNGIVMTDPDGTIEYVNPALESIAGYTEDDALGKSPQILLPAGTGEVFDEEFWRTMADQGEWEGDLVIERKDSERVVVDATVTALRDTEQETEGFVIVLSDITERIQREQDLEDREVELDLLRQILTRYLRHNLRNDLNVIRGNAQLLKEDETLSPDQVGWAETIIEHAEDLIEKSETARTYSTLSGRETELSTFDLSEITASAVRSVGEDYPEIDFEVDVPETCEIRAREGIQRGFEELIDNAARHNDAADPWVRVRVRERDGVQWTIEDNGPGISEQERVALERGTETQLSHSQGIGLWLSKWLIEGIDGRLSIDHPDAGTRITVDLPLPVNMGSEGLEVTTLKERERRLQTISDRMTDAILQVDAEWNVVSLDDRAERILDVDADTIVGQRLWEVFPDIRDTQFETVVRNAMESRSSTSVEAYYRETDAMLEFNVYPEFDGGLSFYTRDVTERVEREEALQETKQRLETIIELSPEPILAIDSKGTVFLWNEAAEYVFGYAPADAIGKRLQTLGLFSDEQSSRFEERFERVLGGETIRGLEVRRRREDGTTVDLSISATPIYAESNTETGILAVAQDITALKERERDLQERVKELSEVHATTDLFQSEDAPVEELLSEFVETIPGSFQYPDITAARVRYDDFEVSTTGFEARNHVLTAHATLDDGSVLELEVGYMLDPRIDDADPFLDEEEDLLDTLVAVVKNHVERRTHLKALERTEDLLTNAEQLGEVGAWEVDLDSTEVFWTDGARRIHGVSDEFDLTPEHTLEYYHPDDRDTLREAIETCAESGDPFSLEIRIHTAEGETRWVQIEGESVDTEEGTRRVRGYVQDVTERKERNRRYEAIFNQTFQFTGLLEPDGTLIEANDTALEFGGISREDVLGEKVWNAHWFTISAETQEKTKADVRRAAAGEFVRRELEVQGAEGTVIIDFSIRPITDDDGEVILLVPEGRDITELKRRERELSELQERYRTLVDLAPDPLFVADAETGEIIETNAAAETLIGESRDQIVGRNQKTLHPSEDADRYRELFESYDEIQQTITTLPDGSRPELVTADGEIVPLEISVSTVSLPDGPVRFAIFRDVSEQVERERQIGEEHARFKAVFEDSFDAMVIADNDGRYIDANESATVLFGLPEEELLGRSIAEFAPPDYDFAEAWERFQSMDAERGTFPLVRADGEKRFVEFAATRDVVSGQHLSILRDVTEETLQERKREQIIDRVTEAIVEVDADWRFTLVNEQAEALYGMDEKDLLGRDFWSVFEAAKDTTFEKEYRGVMETREPTSFVEYFSQLDGWFDIKAYPKDDGGIEFYFVEVTEHYERERELAAANAFLSTLFETIPAGIAVLDADGNITEANSYAEEELGLATAEITDRNFRDPEWEIYDEEGEPIPPGELPFSQVMETGEMVLDYEHGIERPDGSRRWLSINAAPMTSENGTVEKVVAVITDITHLCDDQPPFDGKRTDTDE